MSSVFEILVIVAIVCFQVWIAWKTYNQIQKMKKFYNPEVDSLHLKYGTDLSEVIPEAPEKTEDDVQEVTEDNEDDVQEVTDDDEDEEQEIPENEPAATDEAPATDEDNAVISSGKSDAAAKTGDNTVVVNMNEPIFFKYPVQSFGNWFFFNVHRCKSDSEEYIKWCLRRNGNHAIFFLKIKMPFKFDEIQKWNDGKVMEISNSVPEPTRFILESTGECSWTKKGWQILKPCIIRVE